MKSLKTLLLLFTISLSACSSDDVQEQQIDELDGLHQVTEFSNNTHSIELYSASGELQVGFNQLSLRIKDLATEDYLQDATVWWTPLMNMIDMAHSAPASDVVKVNQSVALYTGHLVFTMPENPDEKWEININYSVDGGTHSVSIPVEVPDVKDRLVINFTGNDDQQYVLSLVQPFEPTVAINDIQMVLYQMESMMEFSQVNDFRILIDPRMPSMGNHGSPNNVNLTQHEAGYYHGALSLTMTGLWRINLQVENSSGEIIKGEAITEANPDSSIYLQFEF